MPTNDYVRERLIRLVRSQPKLEITRRSLIRLFDSSARVQVDYQIGLLISDGVFILTGLGRRGDPEKVSPGPNFPARRCPFCLQDMPEDVTILPTNQY